MVDSLQCSEAPISYVHMICTMSMHGGCGLCNVHATLLLFLNVVMIVSNNSWWTRHDVASCSIFSPARTHHALIPCHTSQHWNDARLGHPEHAAVTCQHAVQASLFESPLSILAQCSFHSLLPSPSSPIHCFLHPPFLLAPWCCQVRIAAAVGIAHH